MLTLGLVIAAVVALAAANIALNIVGNLAQAAADRWNQDPWLAAEDRRLRARKSR